MNGFRESLVGTVLRVTVMTAGVLFFLFVLTILFSHRAVLGGSGKWIVSADDVPVAPVVLVLGARSYGDGRLSDIYRDRIDTALDLYRAGKAGKILVSGDHGRKEYDEVSDAKIYLLAHDVPAEDIFLDHAGFDTYDSLYRARDVFRVESLIVVTQDFHLPRAVYVARALGLEAYGVSADRHIYLAAAQYARRERLAQVKAVIDVILKSKPRFLGPVIPITGDGRGSWE